MKKAHKQRILNITRWIYQASTNTEFLESKLSHKIKEKMENFKDKIVVGILRF